MLSQQRFAETFRIRRRSGKLVTLFGGLSVL
jgi:hypothetical protein